MLENSELVASAAVPGTVITMYTQVLLQGVVGPEPYKVTLCYPDDAEPSQGFISVLSPLGASLARPASGRRRAMAHSTWGGADSAHRGRAVPARSQRGLHPMSAYTDLAGFRSHEVLVITDLAPASTNAVWRAALIAREQGASLRLLYVGGERRCMTQLHAALEEISKQVHARLGIAVNAEVWKVICYPRRSARHVQQDCW